MELPGCETSSHWAPTVSIQFPMLLKSTAIQSARNTGFRNGCHVVDAPVPFHAASRAMAHPAALNRRPMRKPIAAAPRPMATIFTPLLRQSPTRVTAE